MTKELEPCPFCGSVGFLRDVMEIEPGWYVASIMCEKCACQLCTPDGQDRTEEQAEHAVVRAWNSRYKRTCHPVAKYNDDSPFPVMICSECGRSLHYDEIDGDYEYTPYCCCGAEVIHE